MSPRPARDSFGSYDYEYAPPTVAQIGYYDRLVADLVRRGLPVPEEPTTLAQYSTSIVQVKATLAAHKAMMADVFRAAADEETCS